MELPVKLPMPAIAGIALIVVLAAAAAWWVWSDSDAVLFDQLGIEQLNGVAAELDRAGIPYRVDREQSAVVVASKDLRRARLAAMASGAALPDSVGFELFDKSDYGMTDFAQKINYQRAMEGEIARTISAFDEVKYTRVHLVLPEHGLFAADKQRPRAAVTVFLQDGAELRGEQVRSIQRIAASAVPDLAEQDIAIVNQNGVTLSADVAGDGEDAAAPARLLQKKAIETYMAEKIRAVLAKAVGANRFAVSVDVALDLNQKTTTTEKVLNPGNDVGVKRIKSSTSKNSGEGGSEDSNREVEYVLGHESEQVVHSSGEIRRIQVGVIIDNDVQGADLATLRELVATTVGIDSTRGDKVAVVLNTIAVQQAMQQWTEPAAPAPAPGSAVSLWSMLLFALGLLAGIAAVVLLRPAKSRVVSDSELQRLRLELRQWSEGEPLELEQP
jgi:flagellar M-ring protein FliF